MFLKLGRRTEVGLTTCPFRARESYKVFSFSRLLLDQLKQFSRWTADLEKLPQLTRGPKFAPC